MPAADAGGNALTATYYVNDLIASMTGSGTTRTFTLDPSRRLRVWGDGTAATTHTDHYAGDSDSPAWVAENADGSSWTRNIVGIGGELVGIQDSVAGIALQLSNLHGDIVATASTSTSATGPTATFESTEFGLPRQAPSARYGWLGEKMRMMDSLTGLVLMGVRLYSPVLGRFLSVDPVEGGSFNNYEYALQDPVNKSDLDGTRALDDNGYRPRRFDAISRALYMGSPIPQRPRGVSQAYWMYVHVQKWMPVAGPTPWYCAGRLRNAGNMLGYLGQDPYFSSSRNQKRLARVAGWSIGGAAWLGLRYGGKAFRWFSTSPFTAAATLYNVGCSGYPNM